MRAPLALLIVAATTACSESDPIAPGDPQVATFTVNAAADWAFVSLSGGQASQVTVQDRATSTSWDVAFHATSVMLNGGAAGAGDVVGHCICQNAGATDAQVTAMSPESELAGFDAVTASHIPADEESWATDALAPAIDGWWSYDPATHVVSAVPGRAWKVRTASGEAYAKLHVTAVEGATRDHAGRVTFRYALQPSAGAPFEAVRTETVDLSGGPVRFDLETGGPATGDGWDLELAGYDIRVNGGVSGDGAAGAVFAGEAFDAITDASDAPSQVYAGDAFGGVFEEHKWYRYNLQGNHQIWPTYDVFLIRRGGDVYKVQLIGYYGPAGESRHITFRYGLLQ